MSDSDQSPLAVSQRETFGAGTFGKYEYQYHWALCRMLKEHEKGGEYVIFVELHEDVVVGDSLNSNAVKFEFNQVKDFESVSNITLNSLMKSKKGSDSILMKMMQSVSSKPYKDSVDKINLVATCGFNFPQVDDGLNLEVLKVGDLTKEAVESINNEFLNNNIDSDLIGKVQFIVPDLANKGMQDAVIGRIAKLVDKLFPGCQSMPVYIYRSVLDEIHRKGMVKYDYKKWGDLLENKGVTSESVNEVISIHASDKNKQTLKGEFEVMVADLGVNYLQKKKIWKCVERHYTSQLATRNSAQLMLDKHIKASVVIASEINFNTTLELIEHIEEQLPAEISSLIGGDEDIRGAVICEIIMS